MSIPIKRFLFVLDIIIPGYQVQIKDIKSEFLAVFYNQPGKTVKSINVPRQINMMVYDTYMAIKFFKGWSRPHITYIT